MVFVVRSLSWPSASARPLVHEKQLPISLSQSRSPSECTNPPRTSAVHADHDLAFTSTPGENSNSLSQSPSPQVATCLTPSSTGTHSTYEQATELIDSMEAQSDFPEQVSALAIASPGSDTRALPEALAGAATPKGDVVRTVPLARLHLAAKLRPAGAPFPFYSFTNSYSC